MDYETRARSLVAGALASPDYLLGLEIALQSPPWSAVRFPGQKNIPAAAILMTKVPTGIHGRGACPSGPTHPRRAVRMSAALLLQMIASCRSSPFSAVRFWPEGDPGRGPFPDPKRFFVSLRRKGSDGGQYRKRPINVSAGQRHADPFRASMAIDEYKKHPERCRVSAGTNCGNTSELPLLIETKREVRITRAKSD